MHNLSRQGIAAVFVFALMTFVRVPAFAQSIFRVSGLQTETRTALETRMSATGWEFQ